MGSILVAMPKADDAAKIASLVQRSGLMFEVEVCTTGAELLRVANDRDFGAIICTKRLKDMSFIELTEYLPPNFGVIVLTSDASIDTDSGRCVKLMQPIKRADLVATIEMITMGFARGRRKHKQPPKQRSDLDRQIIDRAKAVLMDRNGMTEPEAFRYLQKNSMDYSRSMVESAQMILAMNE